MRVLFILEFGIPKYRNFLFERLEEEEEISDLLVLHSGIKHSSKGSYKSKKLKFVGNEKLGFHIGLMKYLFKYDVVVSSYNLRIISCWLPVFLRDKWIFWGKGLEGSGNLFINTLRKISAKKASKILVYNQYKKEELVKATSISSQKVVAYNNTVFISNPGVNLKIKEKYFLYFGRIQERKGLRELLIQYKQYVDNANFEDSLKLRFVGDGQYKDELQMEVKKISLINKVEFYPGVYDDEAIKGHFLYAKAYVSPYNVGLGIVNSLAYGIPVVTCKAPQVGPEFHYLNEENSFIIDNISHLNSVMKDLASSDLAEINRSCYRYYSENLSSDYMYNQFYNTIIKTYNS